MEGEVLAPFAGPPPRATLTRMVVLLARSRRKISVAPLVSLGTRFVASDWKAMKRPSPLIAARVLLPPVASLLVVADERLTRSVVEDCRSRTKISVKPFVSPVTRLDA